MNPKQILGFILITLVTSIIYYVSLRRSYATNTTMDAASAVELPYVNKTEKFLNDLRLASYLDSRKFNISGHDVMVFLHVQKTGGTNFNKDLVKNLQLERPCKKIIKVLKSRFECKRPYANELWLYSRYSTGWICGLHADWTTLRSCIPTVLKSHMGGQDLKKTRLFYVSLFRDPVDRFLSEFKHVQRGATWKTSTYVCNGTMHKLPFCYNGSDWHDVRLSEFLNCPYNLAFNRQTRMLADLNVVGCYNYKRRTPGSGVRKREKVMLESAKRNLRNLTYFGLVEYQKESQYLFVKTFGLKFKKDFRQISSSDTYSNEARQEVSPKQLLQIRKANRLDRQLYSYARTLFFKRLKYFEYLNK